MSALLHRQRWLPAALVLAAACGDLPSTPAPAPAPPGSAVELRAVTCQAAVRERTVSCPSQPATGAAGDVIIGGQHRFVDVRSDSIAYDSAAGRFTFSVAVQNLIPQAMGTRDGTTPDSGGVKVFFHSLPVVNRGTGQVDVLNADGTGTFTAANQPFFRYDGILAPGQLSASRRWELSVPSSVVSFVFTVYVNAAVPLPDGWVEIAPPDTFFIARGSSQPLTATVHTATGAVTSEVPVAWSVVDASVASVAGNTVNAGAGFGQTRLVATAGALADTTVLVVGIPPLVQVAVGQNHVCALDAAGRAYCWGDNRQRQLGLDPAQTGSLVPAAVRQFTTPFVQIVTGEQFTCALTAAGQTWCWGSGDNDGALGNGIWGYTEAWAATPVIQGGATYVRIAAGRRHVCGLDSSGQAYCWGYNLNGQVGNSTFSSSPVPLPVQQNGVSFSAIAAGANHSCGLTAAGQTWCWGDGRQLGVELQTTSEVPVAVQQGGKAYTSLWAGSTRTCGITAAHQAYCWGSRYDEALGIGTGVAGTFPTAVVQTGLGFTAVAAGAQHTCALAVTAEAYCWGNGYLGQLGTGDRTSLALPTAVRQDLNATYVRLAAGGQHTCGITTAGDVYCWGDNSLGELGIGISVGLYFSTLPVLVKR